MADDDPYTKAYPSPSGAHFIRVASSEMKMSHWVDWAILHEENGSALLDFGSLWSADTIRWLDGARFEVDLRHYPGDRSVSLEVDVVKREVIVRGATPKTWTFEETERWMKYPK